MRYLAIDPGTRKAGVAIADLPDEPLPEEQLLRTLQLLHRAILPLEEMLSRLPEWLEEYAPQRLLLGAGTGSRLLLARLQERFPALHWELVEERDTTLQARQLYFYFHPPRGWRRLLPTGLRVPPEPYDDYVALLLILRAHQKVWGVS
jgi:RNase H-fold protein (predicted Holliday junction resolvase)